MADSDLLLPASSQPGAVVEMFLLLLYLHPDINASLPQVMRKISMALELIRIQGTVLSEDPSQAAYSDHLVEALGPDFGHASDADRRRAHRDLAPCAIAQHVERVLHWM